MYGMFFFLSQFLQEQFGYSPVRTGLAFMPLTAFLFAGSQLSSRFLVERWSPKFVMIGGLMFSTVGLAWLSRLSASSSYVDIVGPMLLFGIGNGFALVPMTTTALAGVAPEDAGAASGLVNVMQQVGGALGLAILVSVFGVASRSSERSAAPGTSHLEVVHHAFIAGADRAFQVTVIFVVATIVVLAVAVKRPGEVPSEALRDEEVEALVS
jgi:fucose permease